MYTLLKPSRSVSYQDYTHRPHYAALTGITEQAGAVGFRIAGVIGGYFLAPLAGVPSVVGAVVGYGLGALFSKAGGGD